MNEVQRLAAAPGSRDYGVTSALAQSACEVAVLRKVGRRVFHPEPNVDSWPAVAAYEAATIGTMEVLVLPAKTSDASLYFDTDHLSRAGLTEFFIRDLKPVLVSGSGG